MAHFTHYVFGETARRRGGGLQTPIEGCGAVCAMMSLSRLLHQKCRCVAALTVISQACAFATVALFVLVCIRTSSTQVCGVYIYVPVRSCDMSLQPPTAGLRITEFSVVHVKAEHKGKTFLFIAAPVF